MQKVNGAVSSKRYGMTWRIGFPASAAGFRSRITTLSGVARSEGSRANSAS